MDSILTAMMNNTAVNNMDEFNLGMTLLALLQMLTDDDKDFDPVLFDYFVEEKGPDALNYWWAKYKDDFEQLKTQRESIDNG